MKRLKKMEERKIRISISIDPEINSLIETKTNNKSKFIEYALLEYFTNCGFDTSKIRI